MKTNSTAIEIKIGQLWNSSEGKTEKLHLNQPVAFDTDEITPISNMECDLLLIKLKGEVTAIINNFTLKLKIKCERCLKDIEHQVSFDSAERQFMAQKKDKEMDPFENFTIDLSKMSIDLADMVRQEIILHFPLISVCSKSCKGLCNTCGANLNDKKCDCAPGQEEDPNLQKPFKDIKSLLKAKPKKR